MLANNVAVPASAAVCHAATQLLQPAGVAAIDLYLLAAQQLTHSRGVNSSCAEHLTVESYTIIISLQSYLLLLVFHHPRTLSL